jgi:competence protein ComEC
MTFHFIDIGQGDATLLEFPCGAALIDTGGELNELFDSNKALLAYLDAFFARRKDLGGTLDLLLITHPHIDHNRSALAVLERYTVAT